MGSSIAERRVWSAGGTNALQLLSGGDRLPEERTARGAASTSADVRLACGKGDVPRGRIPKQHGLAYLDVDSKGTVVGFDALASNVVKFPMRRLTASAVFASPLKPGEWEVPGVQGPDHVEGAWLCDSQQGGRTS